MAAETIIGTRTTLYQVNAARTAWEPFPNQPPGGRAVWGVWGGPADTIWTHDGYFNGSGTNGKYLFFDGVSTWTEYSYPVTASNHIPQTICGSDDGSRVYAGIGYLGATGYIHRWTGSSWVEVQSGYRAGSIWCDPTGQHVYATPGAGDRRAYVYYSDDYGATWTDVFPTLIAQAGGSAWAMFVGTVHGVNANSVYVGVQWDGGGPPSVSKGGRVYKWDGSVWSVYSEVQNDGPRGAALHFGSNALVYTGADTSSTFRIFRDESGVGVQKYYSGHDESVRGRGAAELSDGTLFIAARGIFGQPASTYKSVDDGDTWVEITHPWGTSGENVGSISLANWVPDLLPSIQLYSPQSGGTISKQGPLVVDLLDGVLSIDLDTLSITVTIDDGEPDRVVVAEGRMVLEHWESVITTLENGFRIYVAPDMFETWRSGQAVSFTINVKDTAGNSADQKIYAFTATEKPILLSVYKMVHAGIRRLDDA